MPAPASVSGSAAAPAAAGAPAGAKLSGPAWVPGVFRRAIAFFRRGDPARCVVVLGTGARARAIAARLDRRRGVRVVGFLDDEPSARDLDALGERYRGRVGELRDLACREPLSEVVFALPRQYLAHESSAAALAWCEMLGIDFTIAADFFDSRHARIVPAEIPGHPAFTLSVRHHHAPWKLAVKRTIDLVGSALGIVALLPVWIGIALAIKLTSKGPVFFVQERTGMHGRVFPCLKFRTMIVDAERQLARLQAENELSGPVFKVKRDPRVTRVGAVLRRRSLDELPQLFNVLAGHMSLVGPRPPIPREVEQYEPDHRGRLSMRPGLTCLWQISGRNEIAWEDWVKLDLEYIDRWSLWLDVKILLATLPAVLNGRGAS